MKEEGKKTPNVEVQEDANSYLYTQNMDYFHITSCTQVKPSIVPKHIQVVNSDSLTAHSASC